MPWDRSRPTHVPPSVREACLTRDGNRCTAILNTGVRCPSTTQLEAAHLQRWRPGERTTVDMVRTLCHWHHNRETQAEARQQQRPRPSAKHPREQHPGLR